jgi:hypothetical protein
MRDWAACLLSACVAVGRAEKAPRPTTLEPRLTRLERQAAVPALSDEVSRGILT